MLLHAIVYHIEVVYRKSLTYELGSQCVSIAHVRRLSSYVVESSCRGLPKHMGQMCSGGESLVAVSPTETLGSSIAARESHVKHRRSLKHVERCKR